MKKRIIIAALLLVIIIGSVIYFKGFPPKDTSIAITGNVASTCLYTSTTTIDGNKSVSYATGIFLDDGTYFRIVGRYDIPLGIHTFELYPDQYGESWNGVKSIH